LLTGLVLSFALAAAEPAAVAASLSADLDGDGAAETVTASPARGALRLEVREAGGRRADATAPSPSGDVVPVTLTAAPIGSAGALLEVGAATDASDCRSIWRYRDGKLERLPIRDGAGQPLPDCGRPGVWTYVWESEAAGRPSAWVRERVETVASGQLRTREIFVFAGFSLDFDPKRSRAEIGGIPIPAWYRATLYTRAALEQLYARFDLAAADREPTLAIETDPAGGTFALRFTRPGAPDLVVPVDAFAAAPGSATLSGSAGTRSAYAKVRLAGDGSVPYEVRVEGLGVPFDRVYAPAGSWRGGARQVFANAVDEAASQYLSGVWSDARGKTTTIEIDGKPPYRLRIGRDLFMIERRHAPASVDLMLFPVGAAGQPAGLVFRGPNAFDRVPYACAAGATDCRPAGEAEGLRRLGARVNVR
jgi:hypothetical protein